MHSPDLAPLHVLMVEDDPSLRQRLAKTIEQAGYPTLESDSVESLDSSRLPETLSVAVLDMRLPGANGLQALRLLRERFTALPVVFISGESQPTEIIEGMKLGVVEFLLKPFTQEQLLTAVERAVSLSRDNLAQRQVTREALQRLERLTTREREVLALLVQGHKTGEAARVLGMAPGTAKIHRMHALEKMKLQSVADAVRWLREARLDESHLATKGP